MLFNAALLAGEPTSLREVDEAPLRVRPDQAHAHAVADVEPLESSLQTPSTGMLESLNPRALRSGAGDDGVEVLPDAIREPERRRGFLRQALDLVGRILLTRAVLRQRRQLAKACRAGSCLAIAAFSSRCVTRSGKRRFGAVEWV